MRMRYEIAGVPATAALGAEMLVFSLHDVMYTKQGDDHRDLLSRTIRNL